MNDTKALSSDLVTLLNMPGVTHPEAVHKHECRYWRSGKSHGPCSCGAREVSAHIRVALVAAGVGVRESPNQMHERGSIESTGAMCNGQIRRETNEGWFCPACGWKVEMP